MLLNNHGIVIMRELSRTAHLSVQATGEPTQNTASYQKAGESTVWYTYGEYRGGDGTNYCMCGWFKQHHLASVRLIRLWGLVSLQTSVGEP